MCIHYCIIIHTRLNQREGMRGNTSQSWVKNKKMTFCRGIITAPSHAKLKVRYPPPPQGISAHAWGDPYAHTCTSLCSPNGQPAIQAKYLYSTLLPAFLFDCVVYASATLHYIKSPKHSPFYKFS
jgi:hypothetical protein